VIKIIKGFLFCRHKLAMATKKNAIQPVATPRAGGMAGMGSGSTFLEAKLGLNGGFSIPSQSNVNTIYYETRLLL
jgi:hypothetical protein